MAVLLAGVGTGGAAIAAIHLVDAQRAGFDRTLAARRMRLLAGGDFVHERARLVRAGHPAIAAADADMLVDQHDAIGALERGTGPHDVHARRGLAVQGHGRQGAYGAALLVPWR